MVQLSHGSHIERQHMATPTESNDVGSHSPPIQKTTVKNVTAPGSANTVSAQKKGLGGVLGWLTIPGIILLVFILAYFILSALKSNTEQQQGLQSNLVTTSAC
jgi:hypothetical protein